MAVPLVVSGRSVGPVRILKAVSGFLWRWVEGRFINATLPGRGWTKGLVRGFPPHEKTGRGFFTETSTYPGKSGSP